MSTHTMSFERLSNDFRVDYYLGKFENTDREIVKNYNLTLKTISKFINEWPSSVPMNANQYIKSFTSLVTECKYQDKKFYVIPGDNFVKQDVYGLSKTRTHDDTKTTILRRLNIQRHWDHYYNKPADIPFDMKRNVLFWRGTTTSHLERLANRFTCVTKWWNKHPKIDVGFSFLSQNRELGAKFVKGKVSIQQMLRHKYILSIEGNDKDSGLNWKLNSNSLVFMAKPTCVSWLMEDQLVPNYHYILVEDEFGDLGERYEWCEQNPDQCKQIIQNANDFMKGFNDKKNEDSIEKKVFTIYINNVNSISG